MTVMNLTIIYPLNSLGRKAIIQHELYSTMNRYLKFYLSVLLGILILNAHAQNKRPLVQLWYETPADDWMKSLPLGNGRLGMMVYGGVNVETLALNESSMWAGKHDPEQAKPFGKEKLQELRQLFFDGKLVEGNRLAAKYLTGNSHSFGTHLPIGDLKLNFAYPKHSQISYYKRTLNLNKGLHTVSYQMGDVTYTREAFASNPDDILVVRICADKKEAINTEISLNLLRQPSTIKVEDGQLVFSGQALYTNQEEGGVLFEGRVAVQTSGGNVENLTDRIKVTQADELLLFIDVRTNYKNPDFGLACQQNIEQAANKPYRKIKEEHIRDFNNLFDRVSLSLGNTPEMENLPTDIRWINYKKTPEKDPEFAALFFQYARYLTITSSRENSPLPIALQGFFNDNLACNMSWTNDYHLDINTQQNYWVSNIGNLSECNTPLWKYIQDLSKYGEQTAQTVYGCRGWTAHTVANIWGYTAPSPGIIYGLFPTAGSWIASHLWTEYEYTQDLEFLKETAYPLLKGNAEFLLDYLTETPDKKYLVTGPSISPENRFVHEGQYLSASMMPTCDRVLVYEIFQSTLQAAQILNVNHDLQKKLKQAIRKLPPIRLMANGGIREWMEDYKEGVPGHRHTSHLLSLYPFNQISLERTPDLAKGALTTIQNRLSAPGWEDVEWSRANMICYYARLKKKEEAYQSVHVFLRDFTRENLLSISPKGIAGAPYDIFIFDGNTAGAAGIAEMLVQSQEGYIEFLPCLPKEWKEGTCRGFCVRGGSETDFSWDEKGLKEAAIRAKCDGTRAFKIPAQHNYNVVLNGHCIKLKKSKQEIIRIEMKVGDELQIIRL